MSGHPRILDRFGNEVQLHPSDVLFVYVDGMEHKQAGYVTAEGDLVLTCLLPPAVSAVTQHGEQ